MPQQPKIRWMSPGDAGAPGAKPAQSDIRWFGEPGAEAATDTSTVKPPQTWEQRHPYLTKAGQFVGGIGASVISPIAGLMRMAPAVAGAPEPSPTSVYGRATATMSRAGEVPKPLWGKLGYGAGTVGQLAIPVAAEAELGLVPTRARAGRLLEGVTERIGQHPLTNVETGPAAARGLEEAAYQEAKTKGIRGVGRAFAERATDPNKPSITFREARRFYSAGSEASKPSTFIQRMSGQDYPQARRLVGSFTRELGGGLRSAATRLGEGPAYERGMTKYRQAMQLRRGVGRAAKVGGAIAGGGFLRYLAHRGLFDLAAGGGGRF